MRIHETHPKRGARRQWRKAGKIRFDKRNEDGKRITTNKLRQYYNRYSPG